jgi:hypothetical protein
VGKKADEIMRTVAPILAKLRQAREFRTPDPKSFKVRWTAAEKVLHEAEIMLKQQEKNLPDGVVAQLRAELDQEKQNIEAKEEISPQTGVSSVKGDGLTAEFSRIIAAELQKTAAAGVLPAPTILPEASAPVHYQQKAFFGIDASA